MLKQTNELRRIANSETEAKDYQSNRVFSPPPYYSKSDLEEIVGVGLRESEKDLFGFDCIIYWNNGNVPTEYDRLRFYVFSKERNAQKAFSRLKSNKETVFCEITEEGDNYIRGWEAGVIDADIEEYFYLSGNMIVTAVVTSVDESARAVNDPTPAVTGGGQDAVDLITLITENFK